MDKLTLCYFCYFQKNAFKSVLCVDLSLLFIEKNTAQAEQCLQKCYTDFTPSIITIKRCFANFKCGHTDTNDAEHSGHPNEVVNTETIKKTMQIIMGNCIVKL